MKNLYFKAILAAIVCIVVSSCKYTDYTPDCIGGGGGLLNFYVKASRSGNNIINYSTHKDTTFIKYNSLHSPGTSHLEIEKTKGL